MNTSTKMSVFLLLVVVGVSVADVSVLRDVRTLLRSSENCYETISECSRRYQDEAPRIMDSTNQQYRFDIAGLNIWCRQASLILPCIERQGFPEECSEEGEKIATFRRFYDVICVNNNTQIKSLLSCVNDLKKTILQINFASCASKVIGSLRTLSKLEEANVNIPTNVREEFRCSAYNSFERCSDIIGEEDLCGSKNKRFFLELVRTGFFKQTFRAAYNIDLGSSC
ncbi:hypothetical protein KUTeg_012370 [Tegillarca granosa]|uniref:Uncharacterized protein n=1 Tax=Tegillarca granosa TaxID=220873 RepID=A0ABQ9EZB4_TEGGR|nr:hypothetical protein KUTeg_012370 [Tegillarca granosa]